MSYVVCVCGITSHVLRKNMLYGVMQIFWNIIMLRGWLKGGMWWVKREHVFLPRERVERGEFEGYCKPHFQVLNHPPMALQLRKTITVMATSNQCSHLSLNHQEVRSWIYGGVEKESTWIVMKYLVRLYVSLRKPVNLWIS